MRALSIQNLHKTYPNGQHAVRDVGLQVEDGAFFALLGPNGAGKSTTIGIVCALVNKSSGQVEVFGNDLDQDPMAVKACIGLVPQEYNFNQFEPVIEIILHQAGYYGIRRKEAIARARPVLTQLDLWDKRRMIARQLSGGMKRRLMIARALTHRPRLLILDEPTAGVDIELRHSMWRFLRETNTAGTTIILTTHYLEEAETLCRDIAIIDQGKIVEHSAMHELLAQLHAETFVLNLAEPVTDPPELHGYHLEVADPRTLEVTIPKAHGLNGLFQALSAHQIEVVSLRGKQNRLEQLFLDRLHGGRSQTR